MFKLLFQSITRKKINRLILLSFICLAACTSQEITSPPSSIEEIDGNLTVTVTVYFTDQTRYAVGQEPDEVGVTREVLASQYLPEVVLEELFLGPTPEEQTQGLMAVYSGSTGFNSLVVEDGVAHVYLAGQCNSEGATYTIANLLVVNLKQFDTIEYVKVYDENEKTEVPDGQSDSIPFCLEP
ncbi:MAG: GerMN domain-containing protein [Anaerolineales bacterium]|jgi:hypothetical protein